MNCKPGDIAIVVGNSVYAGRLVEIIAAPPTNSKFYLPNGVWHDIPTHPDDWIIKSLGSAFPGAHGDGMYGCGSDRGLRPISDTSFSVEEESKEDEV